MKAFLTTCLFLLFLISNSVAQDKSVTGTVRDKGDGLPIPGVSVKVKGTTTGTQTNAQGEYSLRVPAANNILQFSFLGYTSQELSIPASNVLNVLLVTDAQQLGEVVVTALGFEAQKDKLGSTSSTVKGEKLTESGETSVLNGLASKASGVRVERSGGEPGAGTFVQIRGQSTITGNTQPLFVVDGIPVSNTNIIGNGNSSNSPNEDVAGTVQQSRLSDLNADDIASMEVLKGASAAALYGTRAANGVIIITTKKGKLTDNKVNISLVSTYSVDKLNQSVPLQRSFGQGLNGLYNGTNPASWGDKIADRAGGVDAFNTSGAYVILPDGSLRYPIPNGTAANPHGGKNSQNVFDHSKELFQDGNFWDNTLSLSGGDEKTMYYTSFSNLDQNGIIREGSEYHRKNFRLNADRRFGTKVKLSTNLAYSHVNADRVQQGSNLSGIFLGGLRTAPDFNSEFFEGNYVDANGAIFPNRQISYRNPIGANTNSGYDNPFWIINKITSTTTVNRLSGSFQGDLTASNWLSFIARGGVDFWSDARYDNYPTLSAAYPGGRLVVQELSENQINADVIAKGTHRFSDLFDGTLLVGFNYNNRYYENIGSAVQNFILPDAPFDLTNSAASSRFPFNYRSTIRTAAAYAQASIGLADQLFLDLTGRSENSSTFANTFFYPSASLAWQFTKLPLFSEGEGKILSFGKFRASYGEVGVQPDPYLTGTYFNPAVSLESYGPQLDASSPNYQGGYSRNFLQGNPDIEPERKREFELGTDLRFVNDRASLGFTYYDNKTTGAIFGIQVPGTTGFTQRNDNAAEIANKGFEVDLGATWVKKPNFEFSTSVVWSKNENKVTDLKGVKSFFLNGFAGNSSRAVEGEPLGVLWGVPFNRDASGNLVLDANGFPTPAVEESILGDPNPNWIGGITNTLRFKNASLSFLFDHVQGGDVWNGTKGALYFFGTHADLGSEVTANQDLRAYDGSTITSGSTFRGSIGDFGAGPVALTQAWYRDNGGGFGNAGSEQFIEDGTRTRLREVSASYLFNGSKFKTATRLSSLELSVTGRNLWLNTDYTGIDPETNLTGASNGRGLDYFNNPSTKSFLFSVKVNY
ncbi:SusC/RagA family TonB-linked outer membrane protein [Daejeonella oryzae]|uniref:SusC/RagA family TonB-linked outer membrane protein n=1 Tax=Daejeonella oryzae TaxID=1122943 RepID=UPI00040829D5|nr:SusC/RagA family TonB-linked outer membrane protein [Daejeonella oryzae]